MSVTRSQRIKSVLLDWLLFSVLIRLFFSVLTYLKVPYTGTLVVGVLLLSGTVLFLGIPYFFGNQTLGMKFGGLKFTFKKEHRLFYYSVRWLVSFGCHVLLLGIPIAINVFLLLWNKNGLILQDYVFSKTMCLASSIEI
ncbi:RDD family protein [Vagococcus acidifermentans]|uniref:Uncharacterized protein n=1 Tax=Vagococcus acidifermentans TaxID=564710 RepID=A0A430ARJ4_9ENTE|nr:RDD family protein [Vagococcus acidifermentans]RSU10675.1 hypothetical protein CBF27_10190 [Vagococcus acidifermentans]